MFILTRYDMIHARSAQTYYTIVDWLSFFLVTTCFGNSYGFGPVDRERPQKLAVNPPTENPQTKNL